MTDSLFHEVYGVYFTIVETIIRQQKPLTSKELEQIIAIQGFGETAIKMLPSIKNQEEPWYLFTEREPNRWGSIIRQAPPLFHTVLERRWLKTVLTDPKMRLFLEDNDIRCMDEQLKNVEPLFDLEAVVYFDQFQQATSEKLERRQAKFFKQLMPAIQQEKLLVIDYQRKETHPIKSGMFLPFKLEYSNKNHLFRLRTWKILKNCRFETTLNLNRIIGIREVETAIQYEVLPIRSQRKQKKVICLITDEREALKRSMNHFSDYKKITKQLDESHYELTIDYNANDETELLIRILSFGPFLKVIEPKKFICLIKSRMLAQKNLM